MIHQHSGQSDPRSDRPSPPPPSAPDDRREYDPYFHAWQRRFNQRALILCVVALPVGVLLELPVVWGLALLGIAVTSDRLLRRD